MSCISALSPSVFLIPHPNDSRASLNQSTPAAQYKVTESRLGQSSSKGIRSATSLAQALSGGVRTAAGVYCASVLTRRAGDV